MIVPGSRLPAFGVHDEDRRDRHPHHPRLLPGRLNGDERAPHDVAHEVAGVEGGGGHDWLRVDQQPGLALGSDHVPEVKVLIPEHQRATALGERLGAVRRERPPRRRNAVARADLGRPVRRERPRSRTRVERNGSPQAPQEVARDFDRLPDIRVLE